MRSRRDGMRRLTVKTQIRPVSAQWSSSNSRDIGPYAGLKSKFRADFGYHSQKSSFIWGEQNDQ